MSLIWGYNQRTSTKRGKRTTSKDEKKPKEARLLYHIGKSQTFACTKIQVWHSNLPGP
jgi:hypothetical protein